MGLDDLRANLIQLISSYVDDEAKRIELVKLVLDTPDNLIPVKGIIAELTPFLDGKIDDRDSQLLRDLYFYCC